MKVVVTGASGVLGTAVFDAFASRADAAHTVIGLAHSRPGGERNLRALNLLDSDAVSALIRDTKPHWVIHCAAERKPDVAEKDPEGTRKLNVDVCAHLAILSKELGFTLIFISTDYVFDGTSPPYVPSAQTNPVNFYGITKRDAEIAVLGVEGAHVAVLRIPILYGPAPSNADSAVNILLDVVRDQSGKKYTMDHYQTGFPTNVLDIADFLVRLAERPKSAPLPPVIHYSAEEPFTKYEICLIFARILGLPHAHIIPHAGPPPPGSTPRPRNAQLYLRETEDLGVEGGLGTGGFEEWWVEYLRNVGGGV
ncbi:NAD-P-binding protein [Russula earlei]|uniref:NAD-P-binding protein n=1 Tax=Russula earlei TaxID=71964 RepID=A0ACC0U922_9AGAM|nr:NAD-P-binding protein [Russula earlei]